MKESTDHDWQKRYFGYSSKKHMITFSEHWWCSPPPKKRRNRPKRSKPRLNCWHVTFNQSIWNFLISMRSSARWTPTHPPKKVTWPELLLLVTSSSCSISAYESFPFCTTPWICFLLARWMLPNSWIIEESQLDLQIYSGKLSFSNHRLKEQN